VRHARLRALQSEFLDGRLSPRKRARVERHLVECAPCRRELRELERTVGLLRALPPAYFAPELAQRVRAEVASRTLRGGPAPWAARAAQWVAPFAAAAAAVLLLTVVQGVEVSLVLPGWGEGRSSAPPEALAREGPDGPAVPLRPLVHARAEGQAEAPAPRREPHLERERALERPLPPMASCLAASPASVRDCARWHSWLVGLAARDPSAFVAEVESLPSGVRERWLGELSEFAAHAGAASWLAADLRASGDPRASSLARRFERTTTVVSRR
jgi:hypothetical protein